MLGRKRGKHSKHHLDVMTLMDLRDDHAPEDDDWWYLDGQLDAFRGLPAFTSWASPTRQSWMDAYAMGYDDMKGDLEDAHSY